jgi:GNAT superfamily N-acetyltransferase
LVTLPGCCGVVVSTGAYVEPKFRKKGIGTILNRMRKRIAAEWGYSLMLCTDLVDNAPQQTILKTEGWEKHIDFLNTRTNNRVALHTIPLKVEGISLGFIL